MWRTTPVAESITEAIEKGLAPVYLVHTTQAADYMSLLVEVCA